MTTVEHDEFDDTFHYVCHDCNKPGRGWDRERDANQDADRHDETHET